MTVTDDGGKAARAEQRVRAHEAHRSRVRQLYSKALANRQVVSQRLGRDGGVPPDHFLARRRTKTAVTAGSTTAPLPLPARQEWRLPTPDSDALDCRRAGLAALRAACARCP